MSRTQAHESAHAQRPPAPGDRLASPSQVSGGFNLRWGVGVGAVLALFVLVAGAFSVPISDIDFWWHIATGRTIVQQGEVPVDDPFGMYVDPDPVRRDGNLRSQWLGQVVLYLTFDRLGVNGVVALRTGLLLACLALVYARCRHTAAKPGPVWAVLLITGALLTGFTGERPQLLSIFFAGLLFLLLDRARGGSWKWLLPLPLLGLLWANSHGGFLLGNALLALVCLGRLPAAGALATERRAFRRLLLLAAAFVLATLVTPSGVRTFVYLVALEGTLLQERTSEYTSALLIHRLGLGWIQAGIYVYLGLAALSLPRLARRDRLDKLLVVAFLGIVACAAYRYLSFFLVVAAPYVAVGLSDGWTSFARSRGRIEWHAERLLLAVLVGLLGLGILRGDLFQGGIAPGRYPTEATRVIAERGTEGRAFNTMNWGGYLLWHLGEQVTPYVDGRLLDTRMLAPYTNALWATPPGLAWLQDQDFVLVILPVRGSFDAEPYPLPFHLATDPEWQLVYSDQGSYVFERVPSS
jgi:hypothetical protein